MQERNDSYTTDRQKEEERGKKKSSKRLLQTQINSRDFEQEHWEAGTTTMVGEKQDDRYPAPFTVIYVNPSL